MTETILVAGAGIAGLNAAMALPRAGRQVIVIDRDPPPPDTNAEDAFFDWERKGVTQLRHSHVFLGRLVKMIREKHPVLWKQLLEAGARESTFEDGLSPELRAKYVYKKGDEDLSMLFSRRTTLELVMRRYAGSLPGVKFITNAGIRGLETELRDGVVAITGLRVEIDGAEQVIKGDAVVDATGRTTQFPEWLGAAGAKIGESHDSCGILYFSRHYRLLDGEEEPSRDGTPGAGDLGYIKFGVFPADNRTFSVTLAVPEIESQLRVAIMKPEVFQGACEMMPGLLRWVNSAKAEPISKVFGMGNLINVWRTFMKDGKPVALNYFPLGDALLRTNPLYGRGCSMGAIQAHMLAEILDGTKDPGARMIELIRRVETELKPFFDIMNKQDQQAIKRAVNEQKPDYKPRLKARLAKSFIEDAIGPATRSSVDLLRDMMRGFHMHENPTLWLKKPSNLARVMRVWATPKALKKKLYLGELGPKRPEGLAKLGVPATLA